MAIITKIESRGIELPKAYVKISDGYLNLQIFANQEQREKGVMFDGEPFKLKINDVIYGELKKQYEESEDVVLDEWKTITEIKEVEELVTDGE